VMRLLYHPLPAGSTLLLPLEVDVGIFFLYLFHFHVFHRSRAYPARIICWSLSTCKARAFGVRSLIVGSGNKLQIAWLPDSFALTLLSDFQLQSLGDSLQAKGVNRKFSWCRA